MHDDLGNCLIAVTTQQPTQEVQPPKLIAKL